MADTIVAPEEYQRLLKIVKDHGGVAGLEAALRRRVRPQISPSDAIRAYELKILTREEARRVFGLVTRRQAPPPPASLANLKLRRSGQVQPRRINGVAVR